MTDVSSELFHQVADIVGDKSIKPVKSSSFADKCRFYGLFKRATVGKLHGPYDADDTETDKRPASRPGILSIEARAKYDAWGETQDVTKQEAMNEYVKLAEELVGPPVTEAKQKAGS